VLTCGRPHPASDAGARRSGTPLAPTASRRQPGTAVPSGRRHDHLNTARDRARRLPGHARARPQHPPWSTAPTAASTDAWAITCPTRSPSQPATRRRLMRVWTCPGRATRLRSREREPDAVTFRADAGENRHCLWIFVRQRPRCRPRGTESLYVRLGLVRSACLGARPMSGCVGSGRRPCGWHGDGSTKADNSLAFPD
jgi:hypothetical protein